MSPVRPARNGEREALAALWVRVFRDPEELPRRFMALWPPEENALVVPGPRGPESVLWDLDFGALSTGEALKLGYAFATLPEARGRGHMTSLLAALPPCNRFYIPADDGLLDWYCSLGAKALFRCDRGLYIPGSGSAAPLPLSRLSREDYLALREEALKGRVHDLPGERALRWQEAIFQVCGGGYYGGPEGGALVSVAAPGVLAVTELLAPPAGREALLEALGRIYGAREIRWTAPAEGQGLPYGVFHPGSDFSPGPGPAPWAGFSFA